MKKSIIIFILTGLCLSDYTNTTIENVTIYNTTNIDMNGLPNKTNTIIVDTVNQISTNKSTIEIQNKTIDHVETSQVITSKELNLTHINNSTNTTQTSANLEPKANLNTTNIGNVTQEHSSLNNNTNELNSTTIINTKTDSSNNKVSNITVEVTTSTKKSSEKEVLNPKTNVNYFNKPIREHIYCGIGNKIIVAITEDSKLIRSANRGESWNMIDLPSIQIGAFFQIAEANKFKISPTDANKIIILGSKGCSWVSLDCGETVKKLGPAIIDYFFHPFESNWAIAVTKEKKSQNLIISFDNGSTWKNIIQNVVQVGWGCFSKGEESKIPKTRILVTYFPKQSIMNSKQSTGWFIDWTYKIDFVYSDDYFETTVAAVQKGNKFILTPKYLFVAILLDEETQEVGLVVSNSNEERYLFSEVLINIKSISARSYTFLDTSGSSIFIHINEFGSFSTFGNIYSSGGFGGRYGLSLEYNIRNKENQCDFESVQGIDGIYFANVIDKQYIEANIDDIKYGIASYQENVTQEDNRQIFSNNQNWLTNTLLAHVQTKITYNKGGNWSKLYPPNKTYDGQPIQCIDKDKIESNDTCYLNLHGLSSNYPLIYSVKSAIGIIIANGNVGKYLSYEEEQINTYISRDAGVSWIELLPGPHIYEIGDSGSIILFAKFNTYNDSLSYTLDQGITFQKIQLKEKIKVTNIITTQDNKAQEFIIVGKSLKSGVIVHIDFSSLKLNTCNDSSSLFSTNTDFEKWIPSNGFNPFNSCLMGKKTEYIRKKQKSHCLLGENFETKFETQQCLCKAEDYECDIGYYRNGVVCLKESIDPTIEHDIFSPPIDCQDTYLISKGYRKVPGNICKGDGISEFEPMTMYCPNNIFSVSSTALMFIMSFTLVVLFLLAFSKTFLKFTKRVFGYLPTSSNSTTIVGISKKNDISEEEAQRLFN